MTSKYEIEGKPVFWALYNDSIEAPGKVLCRGWCGETPFLQSAVFDNIRTARQYLADRGLDVVQGPQPGTTIVEVWW